MDQEKVSKRQGKEGLSLRTIETNPHPNFLTSKKRTAAIRVRTLTEVLVEYKKETYTIDVLLSEKLPENVDPTKLEVNKGG